MVRNWRIRHSQLKDSLSTTLAVCLRRGGGSYGVVPSRFDDQKLRGLISEKTIKRTTFPRNVSAADNCVLLVGARLIWLNLRETVGFWRYPGASSPRLTYDNRLAVAGWNIATPLRRQDVSPSARQNNDCNTQCGLKVSRPTVIWLMFPYEY